jgi:hypothetical protein
MTYGSRERWVRLLWRISYDTSAFVAAHSPSLQVTAEPRTHNICVAPFVPASGVSTLRHTIVDI